MSVRLTMAVSRTPKRKGFTVFRSAAEEAMMREDEQISDNEGGHMSCTSGRVITARGSDKPFKVIMSRAGGETSEHWFATCGKRKPSFAGIPRPPERSTTYDREST